jgi:hypothetical protein
MYAVGDTLRIPFTLYDSDGDPDVDLTAGNYNWPLVRDGVEVSSPSFAISQPVSGVDELLLSYVIPAIGQYSFGRLTHDTAGFSTDLMRGMFSAVATDIDDLAASLAIPPAAPTNTVFRLGDRLYCVRGDDWDETFTITNADGSPRDLTGSTFVFRIGYRTEASDTAIYEQGSITSAAPLTGAVLVEIADTATDDFPPDASLWYDLEETTSGGDIITRGIGAFTVVRDVGAIPP